MQLAAGLRQAKNPGCSAKEINSYWIPGYSKAEL
jgi:hypothetical protein